jgi:hypothetical protein
MPNAMDRGKIARDMPRQTTRVEEGVFPRLDRKLPQISPTQSGQAGSWYVSL